MTKDIKTDESLLFKMEIIKPLIHLHPVPWNILRQQAQRAGRAPRTLQRWIRLYREHGEDGLRSDPKRQRRGKHQPWQAFIRRKFLSHRRPSIAAVHSDCLQKANRESLAPPSYATVRRVINNIPQSVQCYHRNRKEFRNKYQVIGELFQANYPGELYLIDHRKMDLLIFLDGGGSKVGRPWITGVFDQYSRSLPGYYLDFEAPSSRRVALALRHAILPKNDVNRPMCGIPTMLRHDLGKDLVSKHIQQVKIDLKIQNFPKEAANPKANAELERFFGTMADWEKKLPGWTGASVKERPEHIQPKLTLPELDRHFRSFLHEYHDRKHSTTKMAPLARWNTGLIPRLPESEAALDLLLMPVARSRKIRRNGIHFQTNRYWCDELLLYIGDIAALRYDPTRLNEIVVYVGNKRIATAVRVAGSRLTYGAYRNRRKKQIRMIRNYNKGRSQKKEADTLTPASQDLAAFQNKGKKEILDMINHYQKQLEREPEPDKERLKLFPEPNKGDDWC